jgi:hypothetical protein
MSFLEMEANNNALSDKLKHQKLSLECKLSKQIWRPNMARIVGGNYIGLCVYMLANVQTLRTAQLRQASTQMPRKRKEEINEPTNLHEVKTAVNTK